MKRDYVVVAGISVVLTLAASALLPHLVGTANAQQATTWQKLGAFSVRQVRFDESVGGKLPTPEVPRTWRFVGVSNGEKENSNTLWFQDESGAIYVMRGFTTGGLFILDSRVGRIDVK